MPKFYRKHKDILKLKNSTPPLCKCGCNFPVGWNKGNKCWNTYIQYHSNSQAGKIAGIMKRKQSKFKTPPQLCLCGCGVLTNIGRKYISGHNKIGKYGKETPNYINGNSKKRREWRNLILKLDNYICQKCKTVKRIKNLCAHHILPTILFPKLKYKISNGLCLCKHCHASLHLITFNTGEYLNQLEISKEFCK